jgi:hypothetical protein
VFIGTAAVVLILLLALTIKLANRPEPKAVQLSQVAKVQVPHVEQAKVDKLPASAVVAEPLRNKTVSEVKKETVPEPSKVTPKPKKTVTAEKKVQGVNESARVRTLAETTGAPAVVSLSVLPWGEIYLDGRMQGVSPPLMELQVVEGKHEIRIHNTTFPTITRIITVKSGEKIKIKHRFAN